jgi:hypothetical protein
VRKWMILGVALLFFAPLAAAQDRQALSRWGDTTLDKLAPFLPDAKPWGFIPEFSKPEPDFKAFANQGSRKYLALLVHKTWYFGDEKLFKELEEVRRAKAALRTETDASLEEFRKTHGAEIESQQTAHAAEMEALTKQAQELFQQGKYAEGKTILEKVKPFHYTPLDSMSADFEKKQKELNDRENELLARRRSVSFRIETNRTALTTQISRKSNAPVYQVHRNGTLAGYPLFRQADITGLNPRIEQPDVKLAIYVGPANFQNPPVRVGESELKVKCIVVWAWIESRPDTVQADEAAVEKVLATIDYGGLAKLIEPWKTNALD